MQAFDVVLLQPDYEAQTLMEEVKFRQQLEQRSKRSEKKHGTSYWVFSLVLVCDVYGGNGPIMLLMSWIRSLV
jgi:hypothetical protein